MNNIPTVINLLSEQSNQLAKLTGESGDIGKTLQNVIMVCDVVLLWDAFSHILSKINNKVNIHHFHSSDILTADNSKYVKKSDVVVFICQNNENIEIFENFLTHVNDSSTAIKAIVICSEAPEASLLSNPNIHGFISLESDADILRLSFIKILKGETVNLGFDNKLNNTDGVLVEALTPRQQDVLNCIRNGKCNKEIARDLDMSLSTVKVHCMAVYRKLGVNNRMQAALL